jgi:hypothetical protein
MALGWPKVLPYWSDGGGDGRLKGKRHREKRKMNDTDVVGGCHPVPLTATKLCADAGIAHFALNTSLASGH